MDFLELLFWC